MNSKSTLLHARSYSQSALGTQVSSATKLRYAYRSIPQTFGQLAPEKIDQDETVRVVSLEDLQTRALSSSNQNAPGGSRASRLDPLSLVGKSDSNKLVILPENISSTINESLKHFSPQALRRNTSKYYVSLQESGPHKAATTAIDVDTHMAGLFLQNYASLYSVLSEARRRMGPKWDPKAILDIGYGPATGLVALNQVFEDNKDWTPDRKVAVIIGHKYMADRAKEILKAQHKDNGHDDDLSLEPELTEKTKISEADMSKDWNALNTKIRTNLPPFGSPSKYDLIIASHQLYNSNITGSNELSDRHTAHLLSLLAPNGVLILLERGTPLGFESIARARQIMLRPEDHGTKVAKEPRAWKGPDLNGKPGEISNQDYNQVQNNFNLRIVAPCEHHGNCPLQVTNSFLRENKPHKFHWCRFGQMVQRPKFSMEHKKGVFLAAKWSEPDSGRANEGRRMAGSGHPNARSFETASHSYLIVERGSYNEDLTNSTDSSSARILSQPMKRDGHVILQVCAPTGQIEQWTVPRSYSKIAYHDARKAVGGDLWALGAKTKVQRGGNEKAVAKATDNVKTIKKNSKSSKEDIQSDKGNSKESEPNFELTADEVHSQAWETKSSSTRNTFTFTDGQEESIESYMARLEHEQKQSPFRAIKKALKQSST